MKTFIDANILITVLCNEYPRFSACARILSLADNPGFKVFTSPLCLAIGFYFSEKKDGRNAAGKKIKLLAERLQMTAINQKTVSDTTSYKSIHDFEDGLQYYSAIDSKCKCIVTEDLGDYYFSDIEVLNARDFLLKYAVKK